MLKAVLHWSLVLQLECLWILNIFYIPRCYSQHRLFALDAGKKVQIRSCVVIACTYLRYFTFKDLNPWLSIRQFMKLANTIFVDD